MMAGIPLYGGRRSKGRAICSKRYRERVKGKEEPLELYDIDECIKKAFN
jgi:hypothetical protein